MTYFDIIQFNKEQHEQYKLDLSVSANVDYSKIKYWSLNEVMSFTKYKNKQLETQKAIKNG